MQRGVRIYVLAVDTQANFKPLRDPGLDGRTIRKRLASIDLATVSSFAEIVVEL